MTLKGVMAVILRICVRLLHWRRQILKPTTSKWLHGARPTLSATEV